MIYYKLKPSHLFLPSMPSNQTEWERSLRGANLGGITSSFKKQGYWSVPRLVDTNEKAGLGIYCQQMISVFCRGHFVFIPLCAFVVVIKNKNWKTTKIFEAEGNAQAIRIEAQALMANPKVVELRWIEKWNGEVPQYWGQDSPFIGLNR